MALFKCKVCGGTIEYEEGSTVGICDSCGTRQTLPKTNDVVKTNLFNRANNLRLKSEFDKAEEIYEKIVQEDDSEAEAHWGLVLCRYGIEYVEDPATHERIPTCHRTLYEPVTKDLDYLAAIDYSDALQQSIYEKEARAIDRIQKGILDIVKNEKPFDVFICYKETDENGKRTIDSTIANDIYYQLTQEGYKVFYAAITLEDKLGQEYEPYIFAALNSAKVMLVLGTKPEYFNAVWVKNEWSRYMKLMKSDRSRLLIPCYRDMDAYDLPEEFAHLQAQDMSKIGFINDVVRGIKKVVVTESPKPAVTETVVYNTSAVSINIDSLLKRAFLFLEDGEWDRADDLLEQVLNQDPENTQAYIGKLMIDLRTGTKEELSKSYNAFDDNNNYKKALRFGDDKTKEELSRISETVRIRSENKGKTYDEAVSMMHSAATSEDFEKAERLFIEISDYLDSDELAKKCRSEADNLARTERLRINTKAIVGVIKRSVVKDKTIEEEKLIETKDLKRLQSLLDNFDSIVSQINECEAEINRIDISLGRLDSQKAGLGLFAGREKSRIEKDQEDLKKQKRKTESRRDELEKKNAGFKSKNEIEKSVVEKKEIIEKIEKELSERRSVGIEEFSLEDAFDLYIKDPMVAKEVDKLYPFAPIGLCLCGMADSFELGRMVQTKNGEKTPIKWIVLSQEGKKILVLSKYGLEYMPFNARLTGVTWDECSLRDWLNDVFFDDCFSDSEKEIVSESYVPAHRNPDYNSSAGSGTNDKVFVLSINEVKEYFRTKEDRICYGTDYANGNSRCNWWLRTPGYAYLITNVESNGEINSRGNDVNDDSIIVRPAMWIEVE